MRSSSIRLKFILAFLAAALVSIAMVGLFTSFVSNQQFENLVLDRLISDLSEIIADYYENQGTVLGIENLFFTRSPENPAVFENMLPHGIVIALPNQRILLGDEVHKNGDLLTNAEIRKATEVTYNGELIAYLVTFNPDFKPTPQEAQYIERTNKALIYASLSAIGLAVALGLLFTRTLLKPLQNLNIAIKNMEKGELKQDVPKTSNDELGEVIDGFNQMSSALASANARRDQMTADIAHELRNPLTVINGYLEAMQDGSLEITQERLTFIQDEVDQLNRLVNDLRTLALADAGQLDIHKGEVDAQVIFNHLANAHTLQAESKGISLIFTREPGFQKIYADEGRVLQILSNLINNAIRHTHQGGSIHTWGRTTGGMDIISVTDTGEGIAPQDLDLVFDRFYRGDPSRQTSSGESGLGLSIVRALVEAHGGHVTVESEVGKGTTFTISLPGGQGPS